MRGSDYMMGTQSLRAMTAEHLMERDVAYFKKEAKCETLVWAMVEGNFGTAPIVNEEGRLIGAVNESDLLSAVASGIDLADVSAGEMMKSVSSISVDKPAMEICSFFRDNPVNRAPVVDGHLHVVGMISRRDILSGYLEEKMGPPSGF